MLRRISFIFIITAAIAFGVSIKNRTVIARLNRQAEDFKKEIQEKRVELARIEVYESADSKPVKDYYDNLMDILFTEAELMGLKTITLAAGQQDYERIDNYITQSSLDGVRQLELTTKVIKSGIKDPTIMFYFVKRIIDFPVEIKNIKYNKNGILEVVYSLYGI